MAIIRRGYVPQNIPIERALYVSQQEGHNTLRPWLIAYFDECRSDDISRPFTIIHLLNGNAFRVNESFEQIENRLAELGVDDE